MVGPNIEAGQTQTKAVPEDSRFVSNELMKEISSCLTLSTGKQIDLGSQNRLQLQVLSLPIHNDRSIPLIYPMFQSAV